MKKSLIILLFALMNMLILTACNGEEEMTPAEETATTYTLRMATGYYQDSTGYDALVRINNKITAATGGAVRVELYGANQFGDDDACFSALMAGTLDLALLSVSDRYDERLSMLYLPYLVTNYEQLPILYSEKSPYCLALADVFDSLDVQLCGLYTGGFTGVAATESITAYGEPGAGKGLLLACPPYTPMASIFSQFGFTTVELPLTALTGALQTGAVSGAAGLTAEVFYSDWRDRLNHYYAYRTMIDVRCLLMSTATYEKLPKEYRSLVTQALYSEALASFEAAESNDDEYLAKAEGYGVTVMTPSDEELTAMAVYAQQYLWPTFQDSLGTALFDTITGYVNGLNSTSDEKEEGMASNNNQDEEGQGGGEEGGNQSGKGGS